MFDETRFKNKSINWDEIINVELNDPDYSFKSFHKKLIELFNNNVSKRRLNKKTGQREQDMDK